MKVFAFIASLLSFSNAQQLIGSQRDEHNCVSDGGYKWCDSTQSCVRPWMTPCPEITVDTPVNRETVFCPTSGLQMCRMMCSPPKCSENKCAMRKGFCCDYTCHTESQTNPLGSGDIPEDCVSWYDGCNTCSVSNGELGACTMMMCFIQNPSRCNAYSSGHRRLNEDELKKKTLKEGDICFRFCEDNSESFVNKRYECPNEMECLSSVSNRIGFDTCGANAYTCQKFNLFFESSYNI